MSTFHFYCILCGAPLEISSDSRYDLTKCHRCTRHVPVPKRANLTGDSTSYQSVFPPEVLELSVKFKCSGCGVAIRADARCEGRQVTCDDCGSKTAIPQWSNARFWPLPSDAVERARPRAPRMPAGAEVPTLSVEEIDFLRGAQSRKPEAAA